MSWCTLKSENPLVGRVCHSGTHNPNFEPWKGSKSAVVSTDTSFWVVYTLISNTCLVFFTFKMLWKNDVFQRVFAGGLKEGPRFWLGSGWKFSAVVRGFTLTSVGLAAKTRTLVFSLARAARRRSNTQLRLWTLGFFSRWSYSELRAAEEAKLLSFLEKFLHHCWLLHSLVWMDGWCTYVGEDQIWPALHNGRIYLSTGWRFDGDVDS